MWLPIGVVLHELFSNCRTEYNLVQSSDSFDGVRLFSPSGQTTEQSSYLYLISDSMLDDMPHALLSRRFQSHITFLCVCHGESAPLTELQKHLSIVRLYTDKDFVTVFNLCGDLFQRFAAWDRDIHLSLLQEASMQVLLERSRDLLRYPTFVVDHSRNILASWLPDRGTPPAILESIQVGYLTPDATLLLSGIGLISGADSKNDVISRLYTDAEGTRWGGSCHRFRVNGQEAGRMFQLGCPAEDMEYHLTIMALTLDGFSQYFRKSTYAAPLSTEAYESLLTDILEHPNADAQAYRRRIATYMGQSMTGRFMLARVDLDSSVKSAPLLAWSIRNAFPAIFPFVHRNQFYLLRCFTKKQPCNSFLLEGEEGLFRNLFGETPFCIGVSHLFFDLMDLSFAAKQCAVALENKAAGNNTFVRYQDVFMFYLISGIQSVMPPQMVNSPVYALLKEHDLEHGDDLRDVLMCFLRSNQNVNETAEALYMHRNTVAKKLKKIYAITRTECRADSEAIAFIISYFSDHEQADNPT